MDDAFQELDFSEISAKNINSKKRANDINRMKNQHFEENKMAE